MIPNLRNFLLNDNNRDRFKTLKDDRSISVSTDTLNLMNGLGNWISDHTNGVDLSWVIHLIGSYDVKNVCRVHSLLKPHKQEHVVSLVLANTGHEWMAPVIRDWEDWLEKNLTGDYNIFVSNRTGNEKCVEVSFENPKDAILFKMFFG